MNAEKEVTSDHTSFSCQHLLHHMSDSMSSQGSMTRHDSVYLTEAMTKLSCDAELSTKLSSLEDFVEVSHSFFVSVVIIVHVGLLSSYHLVGGLRELFRVLLTR